MSLLVSASGCIRRTLRPRSDAAAASVRAAVRRAMEHTFVDLLSQPLATAEFLVVDTETNGRGGEECELTEVGAVLVGGGELHDRWETLVTVHAPLSRSIQRFTQISQGMVDAAPPADAVLPDFADQLHGRVLVAHNASFDRRVLKQAFARARARLAEPARPVHGRAGPPLRAARPSAAARGARRRARDRGRGAAPRARGRGDVRARVLRALRAPVRAREHRRRRAGGPAADPPPHADARAAHDRRRGDQAPQAGDVGAARDAGRLHLPQRRRAGAVRRQVGVAAHAGALALRGVGARRRDGPSRRRSSTTAPPARSSARSCSSTG